MTDKFKKRVRERQAREGISYSEALRREQQSDASNHEAPSQGPAGWEPTVTEAHAVGRSGDLAAASAMAESMRGKWIAEGHGVETLGSSAAEARATWFANSPLRIAVTPELLDRLDWRRSEIARAARTVGGERNPKVIEIGIIPEGSGAYLRVYIEADGPPATEEWLNALEQAVRGIETLDPIGPFEDYGNDANDYD